MSELSYTDDITKEDVEKFIEENAIFPINANAIGIQLLKLTKRIEELEKILDKDKLSITGCDEQSYEYSIGDTVYLNGAQKSSAYVIYSYSVHQDGRITYTLWDGKDDYSVYAEWQITHSKDKPIMLGEKIGD